jgi:hypothetical protein
LLRGAVDFFMSSFPRYPAKREIIEELRLQQLIIAVK